MNPIDPKPDSALEPSLIDYPCHFPIKVMGLNQPDYVSAITATVRHFDPSYDAASMELRPSSSGKYLGITVSPWVTSREQLDALYRTLSAHPMVKVVL